MKFYCVNDNVPSETISLLRSACKVRNLEFIEIDARSFDYADHQQLSSGNLLYRPAVSLAAIRVEQFLFNMGVATFYTQPDSIFFDPTNSPLLFQRAGIPIPRTIYCSTTDRTILRSYVEQLGGFPLVMKMSGFSSGIGVIRVDSSAALFSLMDYALAEGKNPLLSSYIDQSIHWRLIVIGNQAVTAYKNSPELGDFRTHVEDDIDNFNVKIKPEMASIAVRAVQVLHTEFGGVDILEHPSSRFFLLESNFLCYFAHPQEVAGIDISGMMVEYLLAKAKRLETASLASLSNYLTRVQQ